MRKKTPPIDVFIVDAEPVTRLGLAAVIASASALRLAGEAEKLTQAREVCAKAKPHVLVVDPGMEGGQGFLFIEELRRWTQQTQVVAFSTLDDARSVRRVLQAGACGYIARRDPVPALVEALTGAARCERHIGPHIERILLSHLAGETTEATEDFEAILSTREMQIFGLLGEGRSGGEISSLLGVSVRTVESHQQRIRSKLRLGSAMELRRKATLFTLRRN